MDKVGPLEFWCCCFINLGGHFFNKKSHVEKLEVLKKDFLMNCSCLVVMIAFGLGVLIVLCSEKGVSVLM